MKANMIANMQVAMAGTLKKKKALRAKQKFKNICRAAREGLIEL